MKNCLIAYSILFLSITIFVFLIMGSFTNKELIIEKYDNNGFKIFNDLEPQYSCKSSYHLLNKPSCACYFQGSDKKIGRNTIGKKPCGMFDTTNGVISIDEFDKSIKKECENNYKCWRELPKDNPNIQIGYEHKVCSQQH